MKNLIIFFFFVASFQAYACLDERFHGDFLSPQGMPHNTSLHVPTLVEGENGNVEFDIQIETHREIDSLAIKLVPNPRVKIAGDDALLIIDQLSHTVKATVNEGQRGAIRLLVTGSIDGTEFLENRFIMVM
ncbi:hypothetical protein L4D09_17740 [Photobacterium makurazakiensis]|uniref:hypothetical protein n=1 Tax=Photobacterium makurazakiensis TaxID=2910234 RepID=UPI003D13CA54